MNSPSNQLESHRIESPSGISIRVYRRGRKGTWWFDFHFNGNHRGTSRTKNLRHAEQVAIKKAEEVYARQRLGISETAYKKPPLLKDFWPKYLEQHSKVNKRPRTVVRDQTSANHLLPFFGSTKLDAVSKHMVAEFQAMRQKSVGNREINIETNLLKAILNKAVEWGIIQAHQLQKLKKLSENPPRIRYLLKEEWDLLHSTLESLECKKPQHSVTGRLRRYVIVSIGTMMRPIELVQLKWPDIDFKSRRILIRDSKTKSSRAIQMSSSVYDCIQRLRLIQTAKWPDCEYVFPNSKGRKATSYTFSLPFRKIIKKIGLKDFRRYDLRHTGASWISQQNGNLFALQEIMGHKSLAMTRRYSHLADHNKQATVNILDDQLSAGGAPVTKEKVA